MPKFIFRGRDANGDIKTGERLAHSADNLSAQLIKDGIFPIEIAPFEQPKSFWQRLNRTLIPTKIPLSELGIFSRQMHLLSKSGVPIPHALKRLAENTRNPAMADALYTMVEDLETGQDLASAMQAFPSIFSPLIISMVRVGQSSGRLDEAFLRINQYVELEASAIKNIKTALRYPLFVFITIFGALILINVFVIPSFANVFNQVKLPLPLATRMIIQLSDFFIHYWIWLIIISGLIIVGVTYYLHTPGGKLFWHKNQLRLPIMGKLLKRIILLRFTQSFAITLNSGIPLIEGIGLVAQSINNLYVRQRILLMREAIEHGNSLMQAAAVTRLFSPLELQILTVSEETGELGPMLEQIANFNQREVEYDIKKLSDIIEPILVIILAIMILILALAVYLPIWDMVQLARTG